MSELADTFIAWQLAGHVHPLTCGSGSHGQADLALHQDLGNVIILRCPDCGWIQTVAEEDEVGRMILNGPGEQPFQ